MFGKFLKNSTIIILYMYKLFIGQTSHRLSLYLFLLGTVDRGLLVTKKCKSWSLDRDRLRMFINQTGPLIRD